MRAGTLFQLKLHAAEPAYAFALSKPTVMFESLPVGSPSKYIFGEFNVLLLWKKKKQKKTRRRRSDKIIIIIMIIVIIK